MTVKQLITDITHRLQPLYDPREAAAVASLYVCSRLCMERHEIALRRDEEVPEALSPQVRNEVGQLADGCPVQYVIGETDFYGLPFQVNPSVLIPRPETEELVQMIVRQYENRRVDIWDVGTGSGCIAVSLAKMLPAARVFATDISENALEVARGNAALNGVGVSFACHDLRDVENLPFGNRRFDVIVSNPPYVPASDRASMHRNVAGYEPALALFVPDDDKLWCYDALARVGRRVLNPAGRVFAETYHDFHDEIGEIFQAFGYQDIQSYKDLNNHLRFISASTANG